MIDKECGVRRFIAEYSNDTEELLAEYELVAFELKGFQLEFGAADDDPMFDCYEVAQQHIDFLKMYLARVPAWDFSRSSYYVEASAV